MNSRPMTIIAIPEIRLSNTDWDSQPPNACRGNKRAAVIRAELGIRNDDE
jgi:hypothetical protein